MKGIDIGYTHFDNGEKIHIKYPIKSHDTLISKLTKQSHPNEKCLIKLYNLRTSFSHKYAIKLKNFFYYNFKNTKNQKDISKFNFELSQKTKSINFINFDISPIVKFTVGKIFSFKLGHYEANKEQYINNNIFYKNKKYNQIYDFSRALQSMIPHNRMSFIVNKHIAISNHSTLRLKGTYNKIFSFEDNIKFSFSLISRFMLLMGNLCKILFSNCLIFKKCFILKAKSPFNSHHITSGFRCVSSLVDMSVFDKEKEISNGFNFFGKNVFTLRFTDISGLNKFDMIKFFSPYASVETLLIPQAKTMLHFIYSLGVSLKVNDKMFVDFSLYTGASEKIPIKKKFINRFRIKLGM